MSDYSSLKATINANVKANNNHEITGSIMNSVLNAMVDSLGAGYQFMGVATPTNPGSAQTPDYKCFYLATTPGTYTYLGGLVVADGEVAILKYDSSWTKEVTGIASADKLNQLGQQVSINTNSIDTIIDGGLEWLANKLYSATTGVIASSSDYYCTLKYPKKIHDYLESVIGWAVSTYNSTLISFWKDEVYAGYRIQNGYHLPDGTLVESIDFDTFAINLFPSKIPDYSTKFSIVSLSTLKDVSNEIDVISQDIVSIEADIANNSQMISTILNDGILSWIDGAFYVASTGDIDTSLSTYSCSAKYSQHYYSFLSDRIEELLVASSWTLISFWKDEVYAGYRSRNGYHLPDGTLVESIDFDTFAINLSNTEIADYKTSVVFINISDSVIFKRGFFALGDSTTAGAGSSQSKSWANYLTELATFPSFSKLAISGAFCVYHEGYGRLSAEIDSVPANTTGIVTIMIGTNDFFYDSPLGDAAAALAASYADLDDTTTFANAFRYCLEKLKRKAPNAVIVVMQPLPSFDAGNAHGHMDETGLFAIRDIERTICNAMGIPIVESQYIFGLSRYTDNWNIFFNDFCHPNDVGYQRIAHCMLGKFIEFCQ